MTSCKNGPFYIKSSNYCLQITTSPIHNAIVIYELSIDLPYWQLPVITWKSWIENITLLIASRKKKTSYYCCWSTSQVPVKCVLQPDFWVVWYKLHCESPHPPSVCMNPKQCRPQMGTPKCMSPNIEMGFCMASCHWLFKFHLYNWCRSRVANSGHLHKVLPDIKQILGYFSELSVSTGTP